MKCSLSLPRTACLLLFSDGPSFITGFIWILQRLHTENILPCKKSYSGLGRP